MARRRSPNYPGISLPEAVNRVAQLHRLQGQTPEPRTIVAQHLGFGGLNGAAIKVLSALLKYQLLDDSGDGTYRVSDLAISILAPETEQEKREAIETAAFSYPLFAEFRERWEGRMPSSGSLRAFLIRRQFSDAAIESVWESFRDTHEYVTGSALVHDASPARSVESDTEDDVMADTHSASAGIPTVPTSPTTDPFAVTVTDKIKGWFNFDTQEDLDDLISVLNALKRRLPESREQQPQHSGREDEDDT